MFNRYETNPFSHRNNAYGNTRRNFETVKELVQDGMAEMKKNPSDETFRIWFDYSQKILNLCTSNNPRIGLDYLSFGQSITFAQIPPYEKFSKCIDYLIEIMRYM